MFVIRYLMIFNAITWYVRSTQWRSVVVDLRATYVIAGLRIYQPKKTLHFTPHWHQTPDYVIYHYAMNVVL